MDFTKFDNAANATDWVHLQIDGRKLYWDVSEKGLTLSETENPCRVKLRGVGSNEVFAAFEKYQRADVAYQNRLKKAVGPQVDAVTNEHAEVAERLMDELIVAACVEWENIYFSGEAVPLSEERVRQLIDRKAGHSKRSIRAFLFSAIASRRANLTVAA